MNRMRKNEALEMRAVAAAKVAEQLALAETDIDNAISSKMALSVTMMAAIADAKLSPVLAKDAFDSLGEGMALMYQARSKLMETHHRLNVAKGQIGLHTVSFGPWQECPPISAADDLAQPAGDNIIPFAA